MIAHHDIMDTLGMALMYLLSVHYCIYLNGKSIRIQKVKADPYVD